MNGRLGGTTIAEIVARSDRANVSDNEGSPIQGRDFTTDDTPEGCTNSSSYIDTCNLLGISSRSSNKPYWVWDGW